MSHHDIAEVGDFKLHKPTLFFFYVATYTIYRQWFYSILYKVFSLSKLRASVFPLNTSICFILCTRQKTTSRSRFLRFLFPQMILYPFSSLPKLFKRPQAILPGQTARWHYALLLFLHITSNSHNSSRHSSMSTCSRDIIRILRQATQGFTQRMIVCISSTDFLLSFSKNCLLHKRWGVYMYAIQCTSGFYSNSLSYGVVADIIILLLNLFILV